MSLLKHPAAIVSGLFTAVAALFNIPFVDGIALYVWTNASQWFYISSLLATVSEKLPFPESYATQALVVTGVLLLVKQLVNAGDDLEDSIDDS